MAFCQNVILAQCYRNHDYTTSASRSRKSRYQKDPAYAKWYTEECARRACVTADEAMARSIREAHEPIAWYDRYEPEPEAEALPSLLTRISNIFLVLNPYRYIKLEDHEMHIQ